MKKILIILIIFICSNISFAGMKEDYEKAKQEQKYKFLHQIREEHHRGRIKIIRAKYNQKVSRRYYSKRYYGSTHNTGRMYSNRACP